MQEYAILDDYVPIAKKPSISIGDTWFRYDSVFYAAPLDEHDNPTGPSRMVLELREFKVHKVTAKGVWLDWHGIRRFVLTSAKKRFAHPTKKEAIDSFLARKERQANILTGQLNSVKSAIYKAQQLKEKL